MKILIVVAGKHGSTSEMEKTPAKMKKNHTIWTN
jgi:hypothetical protein